MKIKVPIAYKETCCSPGTLSHTGMNKPYLVLPVYTLESFCGSTSLIQETPLNMKEMLGTTRHDGIWSEKYQGTLFVRLMQFFTEFPGKLYKFLHADFIIAPEGDEKDPKKSLPNVCIWLAFVRQKFGAKTYYWVDPISYNRTPETTDVLDVEKLFQQVQCVLKPRLDLAKVEFSSDKSKVEWEFSREQLPQLVLSCFHGRMEQRMKEQFLKAGIDERDLVDVDVTRMKGFDHDLMRNGIMLANAFQQRAEYDRPTDGKFGNLVYNADTFAGFQLMIPAILDAFGLLDSTLVACYRQGKIYINDPFEEKSWKLMLDSYQEYCKKNNLD